jgi:hypothetical protein
MQALDQDPVIRILSRWPSRAAVFEDIKAFTPDLDMVAVHRWWQRKTIPPRHWPALVAGAERRGVRLTGEDILRAHQSRQVAA